MAKTDFMRIGSTGSISNKVELSLDDPLVPNVCERCFGYKPVVLMCEFPPDQQVRCWECKQPFKSYYWLLGLSKMRACQSCCKRKNICQSCMVDLDYETPVQIKRARGVIMPDEDAPRPSNAQQTPYPYEALMITKTIVHGCYQQFTHQHRIYERQYLLA